MGFGKSSTPTYDEPVSYGSLKDLQHGKTKSESRFGFGRSSSSASASGSSSSYTAGVPPGVPGGKSRYIPPSERGEDAKPFTGRPMRKSTKTADGEEEEAEQQGWGAYYTHASKQAGDGWNATKAKANETWESVPSADRVASGVGNGLAKAAGGAIKYTGKGIWAVGKAAFK